MHKVVYILYRALLYGLQRVPMEFAWHLGRLMGGLAWFLAPGYRRLVLRNLWLAFGHEKEQAELRKIARESFQRTLGNLFCGIRAARLTKEELEARITFENPELIPQFAEAKPGYLAAISHLAAWEIYSLGDLVTRPKPGKFIYQAIRNPLIDAHFRKVRARYGLEPLDRRTEIPKAVRHLRRGGALGVLVDQHAGDQGIWMPFLGRLASTSPVVGLFAAGGKASAAFNSLHTIGPGRWRIRVYPVAPPGHTLSEPQLNAKMQAALEQAIREEPADWFWLHDRWKTPNPNFLLQNYRRGILDEQLWSELARPFRMLVRSPNWLGDAVMAIPAVRAFRRGRPDAHVTILCPHHLAQIWEQEPCVDVVLSFPKGFGIGKVARLIRKEDPFQVGILLPNSLRSALEMSLGGVWHRVGYAGHSRRKLLHQVHHEQSGEDAPPEHHALRYLRLARECGATVAETDPTRLLVDPLPGPPVESAAEPHTPQSSSIRIGLCPGAEYGPTKRWFPERFAGVIRRLRQEYPEIQIEWRIFGVAGDQSAAQEILEHLKAQPAPEPEQGEGDPAEEGSQPPSELQSQPQPAEPLEACDATVINRVGETSLQELMVELKTCRLLLTNDTGTMHLAAALGTPTVAVFGSTEPAITSPPGPGHTIIRNHVPCSPCFLRECPFNLECMQAVSVEEVARAVSEKLQLNAT